jgi:RNA polymerase sigma-70 factor (ECF subfamily)
MARPNERSVERDPRVQASIDWPAALGKHDRWLRTVAYWRLRDAHAVDEVMQEVALASVRQSAPLEDPSKVAPWLYRLTIRYVLLYRRSKGRQRSLMERYEARCHERAASDDPPDPLGWLLADERRKLVRAALEKLAERDAEILLLKYAENWSYCQIADHLGVSESAVESRLHRARARLRGELAAMQVIEVR